MNSLEDIFNQFNSIEEVNSDDVKSQNRDKEEVKRLENISLNYGRAVDDYNLITIIKDTLEIERKARAKEKEKVNYEITKNVTVNMIYKILYDNSPKGLIWEWAAEKVCKDMIIFDFESVSSIRKSKAAILNVAAHENVDLLMHTSNLARVYQQQMRLPRRERSIYINKHDSHLLLFGGILHDFGKSTKLESFLNISKDSSKWHSLGSYLYVTKELIPSVRKKLSRVEHENILIKKSLDELEMIGQAVLKHHSYEDEKIIEKYPLAECVSLLDKDARIMEKKLYEKIKSKSLDSDDYGKNGDYDVL